MKSDWFAVTTALVVALFLAAFVVMLTLGVLGVSIAFWHTVLAVWTVRVVVNYFRLSRKSLVEDIRNV